MVLIVDVRPFQPTTLTAAHPCCDDQLVVRFVLDALVLQCVDDFLNGFLISDQFLLLLAGVFVGSSSRIVIDNTQLRKHEP